MATEPRCVKCRHLLDGQGGTCSVEWCRCACEAPTQRTVTAAQIDEQLAGGTRLAPGVWIDRDGGLHFSVPELLPILGLADTPANREAVSRMMADELRRLVPEAMVVEQDKES